MTVRDSRRSSRRSWPGPCSAASGCRWSGSSSSARCGDLPAVAHAVRQLDPGARPEPAGGPQPRRAGRPRHDHPVHDRLGLAAVTGIIQVARFASVDALRGEGIELQAVAVTVIGGTLLSGGYGSVIGTMLGAITFGMIQVGLVLAGAPGHFFRTLTGLIVVAAVILNTSVARRMASSQAARRLPAEQRSRRRGDRRGPRVAGRRHRPPRRRPLPTAPGESRR